MRSLSIYDISVYEAGIVPTIVSEKSLSRLGMRREFGATSACDGDGERSGVFLPDIRKSLGDQ